MSKNQKRHSKPDEFQKEQIRHLKKELRRKDQEIKQLQRELGYSQNKSPKSERKTKEPDLDLCPNCSKGYLKTSDIGIRKITTCSLYPDCNYRKVSK